MTFYKYPSIIGIQFIFFVNFTIFPNNNQNEFKINIKLNFY